MKNKVKRKGKRGKKERNQRKMMFKYQQMKKMNRKMKKEK